ncbi:photosystem II assembly protein Psb35 [Gloeocapsa sp. PCC 73106]|uniref:photosystem II assembly protein Psb35 n=1 Tax=Gloeocapsa sp. PCC 73106 TaxID=102232 RepID=UPI0002ABC3A2|nr:hypothetical protein [Gloeocapsa sp. PCC 73106]ELS00066.1 hypothetical protein GLO73106DRAFT_00039190 [Gloeocapsa sp. PCC 73106]
MQYLLEISNYQSPTLVVLVIVGVVGFIAAVSIGSIAWYNSKRPQGWQNKERPDFVAKIDK